MLATRRRDVEALVRGRKSMTREELRSLWLNRAVAARLARDPERVLGHARRNLERFAQLHAGSTAEYWVKRWHEVLAKGRGGAAPELAVPGSPSGERAARGARLFCPVLEARRRVKRAQLEHILRAVAQIIKYDDLLVIGSQSVLGSWDETRLPPEAVRSIEADGSLGEGSRFHETFGIYVQGVSLKTAVLPEGWRDRLVKLDNPSTHPGRGLCLEPHDCVLAKMVAGRQKDYDFATALLTAALLDPKTLAERIELLGISKGEKARICGTLSPASATTPQ
jgi:hypothetical protein